MDEKLADLIVAALEDAETWPVAADYALDIDSAYAEDIRLGKRAAAARHAKRVAITSRIKEILETC